MINNSENTNGVVMIFVLFCTDAYSFKPSPDDKILDWSKLKKIADDISKFI